MQEGAGSGNLKYIHRLNVILFRLKVQSSKRFRLKCVP